MAFVHLHNHSDFSILDAISNGINTQSEIAAALQGEEPRAKKKPRNKAEAEPHYEHSLEDLLIIEDDAE